MPSNSAIVIKPEVRKCIECGMRTIGSIGAAGIYWPMLCQSCKDFADGMALTKARVAAAVATSTGEISGLCRTLAAMDPDVEGKGAPLALLGPGAPYTRPVNTIGQLLEIEG